MKRYKPYFNHNLLEEWTQEDESLYNLFESYINKVDYGNKLSEFGIPKQLKQSIKFIKQLAIDTGFKIADLFKLFLNKKFKENLRFTENIKLEEIYGKI